MTTLEIKLFILNTLGASSEISRAQDLYNWLLEGVELEENKPPQETYPMQ